MAFNIMICKQRRHECPASDIVLASLPRSSRIVCALLSQSCVECRLFRRRCGFSLTCEMLAQSSFPEVSPLLGVLKYLGVLCFDFWSMRLNVVNRSLHLFRGEIEPGGNFLAWLTLTQIIHDGIERDARSGNGKADVWSSYDSWQGCVHPCASYLDYLLASVYHINMRASALRPVRSLLDTFGEVHVIRERERLLEQLRHLHDAIQRTVVASTERTSHGALARVVADEQGGDTIYALDRISEEYLVDWFEREIAPERPLLLVAEGLPDSDYGSGMLALPRGIAPEQAEVRILMDPVDGTRGLMFQKRSAWILTGVAPNHGPQTRLRDIELALQTEIPLVKQHLADTLWAIRGEGMSAERYNRITGEHTPLTLHPDTAISIAHRFATVSRFIPGARVELSAIDEEIMRAVLGPAEPGKAQSFEDQYISSGGQLYGLIAGQDVFVADLRALIEPLVVREGRTFGLACHPYDLATALIAEEAGILLTDGTGNPLDAPLDTQTDVAWVGYANEHIRARIEPSLLAALSRRGLI